MVLVFLHSGKVLIFNAHFQGAGKSSFFINGSTVYAFKDSQWGNILRI